MSFRKFILQHCEGMHYLGEEARQLEGSGGKEGGRILSRGDADLAGSLVPAHFAQGLKYNLEPINSS